LRFRLTSPRYSVLGGRTWLTYPDLGLAGVVHGIAVFKESHHTVPYERWIETASAFTLRHVLGGGDGMPGLGGTRRVMIPRQVHGKEIKPVGEADAGPEAASPTCDGLVTDVAGLAVAVSVADCLPVFAVDASRTIVGVAHCGWRGIAAGVVEEFARSLGTAARLDKTTFLVGAGIGPCCYQVREDLLGEFPEGEVERFAQKRDGAVYFDLKLVAASRLEAAGADPAGISIDNTCTSCQKYILSSFRRDGARCGRMLALVARTG
jgi:YfiH family protein